MPPPKAFKSCWAMGWDRYPYADTVLAAGDDVIDVFSFRQNQRQRRKTGRSGQLFGDPQHIRHPTTMQVARIVRGER